MNESLQNDSAAQAQKLPVMLSEKVREFLSHPAGGVEATPEKKDQAKVRSFIKFYKSVKPQHFRQ
jgi:hypothetical protein